MFTIAIPQGSAFFQQRVELEGVNYTLDFAWVARAGCWSLAIFTDEGELVITGIAIVTNRPLLARFHHLKGLPPGELLFVDLTETISAPNFEQLTELMYFDAAEWAARAEA